MSEPVFCFLPCRKGSQRVPRKNVKPFGGYTNGLIQIKIKQLLASELVDEIVLSTNDDEILSYAKSLNQSRIRIHRREEALSSSQTSTDQLVAHALSLIPEGNILWTHVTSPFITASVYDTIIRSYREKLQEGYDSLMTTTPIHGFLWQEEKPINYNRSVEKWPRTQTLEPIHEVNSGVFLGGSKVCRNNNDRIGRKPWLYALDKLESYDIDWPEDFAIAECMLEKGIVTT